MNLSKGSGWPFVATGIPPKATKTYATTNGRQIPTRTPQINFWAQDANRVRGKKAAFCCRYIYSDIYYGHEHSSDTPFTAPTNRSNQTHGTGQALCHAPRTCGTLLQPPVPRRG